MNKTIKTFIITLLSLGLMLMASGCTSNISDDSNNQETNQMVIENSSEVISANEKKSPASLEEEILVTVKAIMKSKYPALAYDTIEITEAFEQNIYMIKTEKETFSDGYYLYDSKTKELFVMPTGGYHTSDYKILNKNHVIFYMKGQHNESSYKGVPFIYDCKKIIGKDDKVYFSPFKREMYFPLNETIALGGKKDHLLKDIIIALNGIEIAFGPQDPNDAGYFAAYTIPPVTKTSYNKSENQLLLTFEETITDEALSKKVLPFNENNPWIKSLALEQKEDSLLMIIELKEYQTDYDNPKYYTVTIDESKNIPAFIEVAFHNELANDYKKLNLQE